MALRVARIDAWFGILAALVVAAGVLRVFFGVKGYEYYTKYEHWGFMIKDDKFGLKTFQLVESSEQGMLSEVQRATSHKEDVVFLGWAPHPMNVNFQIEYLTGGDDSFGPNFGGAIVYTNERAGFAEQCPNAAKLIKQLIFTVDIENLVMNKILTDGDEGAKAAASWLKTNPKELETWLEGVTTFDGQPGLPAVKNSLGL